ncbi:SnoaL-like domain-containing protein [Madurella fahalii]|uniref:SnoaL-like domain-containing protein n=1 Tax=Madurella fahalii TaxID=1157608 RepID=A0ABQ0FWQ9_9PEZI
MRVRIGAVTTLGFALWVCPWLVSADEVTTDSLTQDLFRVESVREIKNLQRTFAQLVQYGRWREMASLFSDTGVLRWGSAAGDILSDAEAVTAVGPEAIEKWLRGDAGAMDGVRPGSMHVCINDMAVVTLSGDGQTAKGRWTAMRMLGDGAGATRIDGGIFENEYAFSGRRWEISLLRYYPLYAGNYDDGWKNSGANGTVPVVPYHFTPNEAGTPVLLSNEPSPPLIGNTSLSVEELSYRISQLNEEDEVRNLVHSMGYYVDRRMWPDVASLFTPNGTITVQGRSSSPGPAGIQSALARMGPEGLTTGILNEHPIFSTIVQVHPSGRSATARGLEIGLIGDSTGATGTAQWQFCVFRHTLIKDGSTGAWKIHDLNYTRLLFADYAAGWGNGGILAAPAPDPANPTPAPPEFLRGVLGQIAAPRPAPPGWRPFYRTTNPNQNDLNTLRRLLSRSAAYDDTENVSGAYGFYADDSRCDELARLHARNASSMVSGAGWFRGKGRIGEACRLGGTAGASGAGGDGNAGDVRSRAAFHWRIQPVVLVSQDGRSTTLRTRELWSGTSTVPGENGFGGGMYHDQVVLESDGEGDGVERRRLWCLTVDESFWTSGNWSTGWAGVERGVNGTAAASLRRRQEDTNGLVPDLSLQDSLLGDREVGFAGGPGTVVNWPDIRRMWWEHRNPVTGAVPDSYWAPGCVPCREARPDWSLAANGYQEPATGPTVVAAAADGSTVSISVAAGPEEYVWGIVELHAEGASETLLSTAVLDGNGNAELVVPSDATDVGSLVVYYLGNDQLRPSRTTVH